MPSVPGARERAEDYRVVVAALLQFRQRDLGDRRAGCGRRAGDRAEDAAGEHVHVQEPARHAVEPRREPAEHLLRQVGAEQDLAHPDEQRQRRQFPRRAVAPDLRREHRARRNAAGRELHAGPSGREQRNADPHAARKQHRHQYDEDDRDADGATWTSAPLPKFAIPRSTLFTNFGSKGALATL